MKALSCVFLALFCCATPARADVHSADIGEIDVNEQLVAAAELLQSAPDAVFFRIDSPGGYVGLGLEFIELMRAAQAKGTVIHCTIPSGGMAASMAAVIFEQCDVRKMEKGAALMFHTVSVGEVGGNQWDLERMAKSMASLNKRLAILASRKMKISRAEYEANTQDFDWWLDRDEAAAVGAAD